MKTQSTDRIQTDKTEQKHSEWCRRRCRFQNDRVSHSVEWWFWHRIMPLVSIFVRLLRFLRLIIIISERARNHFQVMSFVCCSLYSTFSPYDIRRTRTHGSIESHRIAWHHGWIGGSVSLLSLRTHSFHKRYIDFDEHCKFACYRQCTSYNWVWVCANCLINYFIY